MTENQSHVHKVSIDNTQDVLHRRQIANKINELVDRHNWTNNVVLVTTTYTVDVSDGLVLCDATAGAFTVTLPSPSVSTRRPYFIKKIDSSANVITISGNIDGAAKTLSKQYSSVTIETDGTSWYSLGSLYPSISESSTVLSLTPSNYVNIRTNGAAYFDYPSFTSALTINDVVTSANQLRDGFASWIKATASQSSGYLYGFFGGVHESGVSGVSIFSATGALGYNLLNGSGTRTITTLIAVQGQNEIFGNGLTITNAYGGKFQPYYINSGSVTVTNAYSLYAEAGGATGLTNNYMCYLEAPTFGTNKWGLFSAGGNNVLNGDLSLATAGNGLKIKEGTNATMGRSKLVAGTVTVSTTKATTTMEVFLTRRIAGGTAGNISVGTVIAGTSFVINSTSVLDTSDISWLIIDPA